MWSLDGYRGRGLCVRQPGRHADQAAVLRSARGVAGGAAAAAGSVQPDAASTRSSPATAHAVGNTPTSSGHSITTHPRDPATVHACSASRRSIEKARVAQRSGGDGGRCGRRTVTGEQPVLATLRDGPDHRVAAHSGLVASWAMACLAGPCRAHQEEAEWVLRSGWASCRVLACSRLLASCDPGVSGAHVEEEKPCNSSSLGVL